MRGFQITAITPKGELQLKNNMEKDRRVTMNVVCENPLSVSFLFIFRRMSKLKQMLFKKLASEQAVRVVVSDFMKGCVVNEDFSVEVLQ